MIWLLRHGDAEDRSLDGDDASRELTEEGRRQARAAGIALAELGAEIDACYSSPKVRARQTAEIACEELGIDVVLDQRLGGGDFEPESIGAGTGAAEPERSTPDHGSVLLVGHEPDFSGAVAGMTGARVKLKKGGMAVVEDRLLHALLRPADLRRIASGR